jgi:hypothetical protein
MNGASIGPIKTEDAKTVRARPLVSGPYMSA